MHHLIHSAVVVLLVWTVGAWLIGLIPGIIIGRKTKR